MSLHGIHHIHLPETESTNKYAKEVLPGTGPTLISTDHQTAGRGQRGNSWESEVGKNLLFSLIISPEGIPGTGQFAICELISVAICEVLDRYVPDIRIKWPNDIYHRDQKLCGILIEHDLEGARLSRTIIGVGLNVNQTHFTSNAPNPVSLYQILGHEVNRETLLESIAEHFTGLYHQYTSSPPTLHRTALHERYTRQLYRKGEEAMYRDAERAFTATLHGVEHDGRLILIDQQGERHSYLFKEVAYII